MVDLCLVSVHRQCLLCFRSKRSIREKMYIVTWKCVYYNASRLKETISPCGRRNEPPNRVAAQSGDSSFLLFFVKYNLVEMIVVIIAAFTIFEKKVGREYRIPFEVSADPFYSESNIRYLEGIMQEVKEGKAHFAEHDLIEVDEWDWCGKIWAAYGAGALTKPIALSIICRMECFILFPVGDIMMIDLRQLKTYDSTC